jgi:hypothetical protein
MWVTIERTVTTDGGYGKLYGLPFPYISNSYTSSMSYDVYVVAMLFDLACYFLTTLFLFKLIEKAGLKLITHWIFIVLGLIITTFWLTTFVLMTSDSVFYAANQTQYKTTKKAFIVGLRP